jgi:hypothetical protein
MCQACLPNPFMDVVREPSPETVRMVQQIVEMISAPPVKRKPRTRAMKPDAR